MVLEERVRSMNCASPPHVKQSHSRLSPSLEVLDQAGLCSIHTTLMLSQLRWAGHITRMPDHWLPKSLFYEELQQGVHSKRGEMKRFKDALKTSMKAFNIHPDIWEQTSLDRARWRYSIHKGVSSCEDRRTAAVQQKRQARKAGQQLRGRLAHSLSKLSPNIPCMHWFDQPPAHPQTVSPPSIPRSLE